MGVCVGVMVVVVMVVMVVEPERDSRVFAGGERWRDVNSNSNGERTEGRDRDGKELTQSERREDRRQGQS